MIRGAWQATVHRVQKNRIRLSMHGQYISPLEKPLSCKSK